MYPVNKQLRNSKTVNTSVKRSLRQKHPNEDNIGQCILQLVKGKYLRARGDVRQLWCPSISRANILIQDAKTVYNNLQSYREKSKLNVRLSVLYLSQSTYCLISTPERTDSSSGAACTIK